MMGTQGGSHEVDRWIDGGTITVSASAVCVYPGQEVNETVALALTPVAVT
jgi:hypothetical protein